MRRPKPKPKGWRPHADRVAVDEARRDRSDRDDKVTAYDRLTHPHTPAHLPATPEAEHTMLDDNGAHATQCTVTLEEYRRRQL